VGIGATLAFVLFSPHGATAAFPGQNGRIAFVGYPQGHAEIYTIEPDGSDKQRLTHDNQTHQNFSPSFDPSGRRITWDHRNHLNDNIWLMHADGTHRRLFVDLSADLTPVFSPSGHHVAFASGYGGAFRIYVARVAARLVNEIGHGIRRLSHGDNVDDRNPSWSKKWVTFDRTKRNGDTEIYLQHPKERNATRITGGPGVNYDPSIAPDARRIAFVHRDPGPDSNPEIWTMRRNGSQLKQLTLSDQVSIHPAFSPNRKKIAFERVRPDGSHQIRVLSQAGADSRPVTSPSADSEQPDWGPRP
jgi:TolB protein